MLERKRKRFWFVCRIISRQLQHLQFYRESPSLQGVSLEGKLSNSCGFHGSMQVCMAYHCLHRALFNFGTA